ncbi:DUF2852 domain-containing protein [Halobacteriovorax sp. HLS]|uniref:DUF2852 domain-containing protein n=1 Tax=Halobacteriovorax sp. HLS TaxID=2234000 RepID=UPI0013E37A32|nr:DUF2852 domain-containing protein [Halobacteriovorax sp. HLS]
MKNLISILLLVMLGQFSFAQGTSNSTNTDSSGNVIDPLDNYIDPATQLDYKAQLEKLNDDQKEVVFERCMMFTIQAEMGQSGEDSMSAADIEAYENLVAQQCKCVADGSTWVKESTMKGECKADQPAEKDLLVHTMDLCVGQMQLTDDNCKNNMTDSCVNDFRYQCYQYMTQPQEFSEKSNPVLNKCEYDDQTKNIKMECRSYCYIRKTCEVTQEDFKNRKIGNIYLLQKKSRSSCVKGSTYGIDSDNKMWVNNSCHGEFAIQYKDPKCGFRPTCSPKPHETDNITQSGTQTFDMVCDGKMAEVEGGKFFCKAHVKKIGTDGKMTDEPDYGKEITYISDVKLGKKIGAAKCNQGGNGSAIDFSPRNKGSNAEGWGIEVQNKCHSTFTVTAKWKLKLCTLAGQETTSGDTCCGGLYFDNVTKTCNVPAFNPGPVEEEAALALDYSKNACSPEIPADAQGIVDKYFVELGYYENMFTLIDGSSDGISSIETPVARAKRLAANSEYDEWKEAEMARLDKEKAEFEKTAEAMSDAAAKEEFVKAQETAHREKVLALEEEITKRKNALAELEMDADKTATEIRKSTYDSVKLVHDAVVRFRAEWSEQTGQFNDAEKHLREQGEQYTAYLKKVDSKKVEKEDTEAIKGNIFMGMDIQGMSHESQKLAKHMQISYIMSIKNALVKYEADLEKAAHAGQNLAWYCAHNENCSEYNWLIRDRSKEEVVDFLHDAPHPFKLVQARGRMLPKISKVNKLLVDTDVYSKFEQSEGSQKGMANLDIMNQFFSYQAQDKVPFPKNEVEGDAAASKDADKILNLFRQYTQEFPLRENSLFKDNEILKNYLAVSKEGKNKDGLPLYCEKQEDYDVRVPIGKAIEPLRMLQMVRVVKKFYDLYLEAYSANEKCLIALDADRDPNAGRADLDLRLTQRAGGEQIVPKAQNQDRSFVNGFAGNLKSLMGGTFGSVPEGSFFDNLSNREPGSSNLDAKAESELSAIKKKEADRISKLIKRRINRKKDKDLDNYIKSLGSTLGATLTKRDRQFASLSPSGASGLSGISGVNDLNSALSGKDRDGSKSSGVGSWKGSTGGSGYTGGSSRPRYGSSRGNGSNGGSNSGSYGSNGGSNSGANSANEEILSNVDDSKFDSKESDSIFEKVTKRYIRTAYPFLLETKKKEEK